MKKTKWIIFWILVFACLGYFREFFFVHLNNIMYRKFYQRDTNLPVPQVMQIFENFSYGTLYYSKYMYTLLWAVLFFLANYVALKQLSHTPYLQRILVFSYVALLVIAGISMLYGLVVHQRLQDDEYTLSRWLLGIAQSPIICLILLASEKLYNKQHPSL